MDFVTAQKSRYSQEMTRKDQMTRGRKELQQSRIKRDEEDVCKVISVVESIINPFEDIQDQLVHIASGCVASKDVTEAYTSAWEKGDAAFITYSKDHLQGSEEMFKPLKEEKTKTFQSMNKSSV